MISTEQSMPGSCSLGITVDFSEMRCLNGSFCHIYHEVML